jgi:RNA 2',3'-cyclic 3'-phosphodiesterase
VAVDPPPEVGEQLAEWARSAAGALGAGLGRDASPLRLLKRELLHITVCFLGSRPVEEIDSLAAALEGCAAHACELALGPPLWLPTRRPRSLAVAVHDPDGELSRLHAEVSRELAAVGGWEPQARRFRAHVTVARVRGGRSRGRGAHPAPPSLPPTPRVSFIPESLALYRSWLEPSGARYEAIRAFALLPAGG